MLDLGTGSGFAGAVAREMVGDRGQVVGLDRSVEMLAHARANGLRPLVCGDAATLPFRDGQFDAVVANFLVSYFARPAEALREPLRVLQPGGRLGASAWNAPSLDDELNKLWKEVAGAYVPIKALEPKPGEGVPSEKLLSDAESFRRVLETAGLHSVRIETREYAQTQDIADYLAQREAVFAGRVARKRLDGSQWEDLRRRLDTVFRKRHPDPITITLSVHLAVGLHP